jgi:hypothetical protein
MLGRKGSGKTTQLCKLLSQPEYSDRSVLVDPPGNIEFGVTVENLHSMQTLIERQADRKFRIRYVDLVAIESFAAGDDEENFQKIEAILGMCLDVGNCTLVIDEVDMFCSPRGMPPTFKKLLARGRHDSLNLLWTTRRPQEVSKMLLSQSDEFYLFQMHHPADIDYFRNFMPVDRDAVMRLQVGQCLHWKAGVLDASMLKSSA